MAIAVSAPEAGRLTVQKLTDYRLHLAASAPIWPATPPRTRADLRQAPDRRLHPRHDLRQGTGLPGRDRGGGVPLASNSVSVQLNWLRHGAGSASCMTSRCPRRRNLRRCCPTVSLTRAFWLIRHADDRRLERLNRFADRWLARSGPRWRLEAMA
jgi:hypothetical protein